MKKKPEHWQIVRYLRRGFRTARELARWAGVSRIHAYRLIQKLAHSEHGFRSRSVRENPTGPRAKAYQIVG